MRPLAEILEFLRSVAPLASAEKWDNVGLLIGDSSANVQRVITCLTLTSDVAEEAIRRGAQLVVTHHPVLFRPVQRITSENAEGRLLLGLIQAGVAVYSAHTAYDSARSGINQQLAKLLELREISPIRPLEADDADTDLLGSGRCGVLPRPIQLKDLVGIIKQRLGVERLQFVGNELMMVERLGIACGSAAEFLRDAHQLGCQALLTGEGRFHAALEARELGIGLILAGHYATERPAMLELAKAVSAQFTDLTVWASEAESDPLQWS